MTALYVPPTGETDPKKQNQSIQLIGGVTSTNTTNIATNTASIVTNTANIATNTASIAAHEAAWTAYTPTLTAIAGTFTTASASGRYKTIGKTVFVSVEIVITTVGTGTYPLFTLPVAPLDITKVSFYGVETAIVGNSLTGRFSGTTILVAYYNNVSPSANGAKFELSSVYEAA